MNFIYDHSISYIGALWFHCNTDENIEVHIICHLHIALSPFVVCMFPATRGIHCIIESFDMHDKINFLDAFDKETH